MGYAEQERVGGEVAEVGNRVVGRRRQRVLEERDTGVSPCRGSPLKVGKDSQCAGIHDDKLKDDDQCIDRSYPFVARSGLDVPAVGGVYVRVEAVSHKAG